MKSIKNYSSPLWLSTIFFLSLTACGGGGHSDSGGYGSKSESSSSKVSSSVISSVVSSSSSSTSVISSVPSSSVATIDPLPITNAITNAGGTYVAKGQVSILVNSSGAISVQQLNKAGFTLYVFDKDTTGVSACTSTQCMTTWPPLAAESNAVAAAPFTIITRGDGNKQWALRDMPLYFFASDTQVGDVLGEGIGNVWHVANYAPVLLNQATINAADGDYFVASGKILMGIPSDNTNTSFSGQLTDRNNFALYNFDNDTANISNCSASCLAAWPPLLADANDKAEPPFTIINRTMGTGAAAKQWAYQGKPLYFFSGDLVAADTLGKGIPKWHLARPQPTQVMSSVTLGSYFAAAGVTNIAQTVSNVEVVSSKPMHGFSLYMFDNDSNGVSNCMGGCLTTWPALMASVDAVATPPFSLITRTTGMQWALNGMPLYYFSADTKAGDTKGEGVAGLWHLARTAPVVVKNNVLTGHGNLITSTGAADTGHNNFTLYTFDSDSATVSACTGGCATVWPPLFASATAKAFGDFTVIVRDAGNGIYQWAYKDKPLYFYSGDSAAGDVTGNYGSWHTAKP